MKSTSLPGLLKSLSREEITGVMAHELAHVRARDTLIMTITATIAGAISMLANFALFFGNSRNNPLGLVGTLALMILAPLAAALVQMAISRTREYQADRIGAEICGRPLWLASALERLEVASHQRDNHAAIHTTTEISSLLWWPSFCKPGSLVIWLKLANLFLSCPVIE